MTISEPFEARWDSRCAVCEVDIHVGDEIRMTRDGAIHEECVDEYESHG